MRMVAKDEYAVVLDFLPLGKIGERRSEPIAQVIGEKFFNLLEVGVREGIEVKVGEKVYIGPEKREKIRYIKRKITYDELTNLAKKNLKVVLEELVKEELIVNFFNKSVPLSARFHMMELLPGIGKKILVETHLPPPPDCYAPERWKMGRPL